LEVKKKMKIVNLTPHSIILYTDEGKKIEIPPSGTIARVHESTEIIGKIQVETDGNIPVIRKTLGQVENLPEPREGTIYIVSLIVAQALAGTRSDVYVIGESIRDKEGRVIGARSLAQL